MPYSRDHGVIQIIRDDTWTSMSFIDQFETMEHVREIVDDSNVVHHKNLWRTWLRVRLLQFLHPFGIHDWVPVRIYVPETKRVIDPGQDRWVCRNCD